MENLIVKTAYEAYPISIHSGFGRLVEAMQNVGLTGNKLCIISDSSVSKLYQNEIIDLLKPYFSEIFSYSFPEGEQNKRLETITKFYDFFLSSHFDRKTIVAGLGGGVTGDMAGFAAATYLRGIPFVQIPTSLLAQVDSSVGGKVGVDYKNSKNIIGAFYQPKLVYINTDTLDTLSDREFSAGMAEVIKYGLILSSGFYDNIRKNCKKIMCRETGAIAELIFKCCEYKTAVVAQDEKESGLREILNFGHTIGHSIETLKGFSLVHGECVAIGMRAGLHLSFQRGDLLKRELEELDELLTFFKLPLKASGILAEDVYKQLYLDKKVKDNKIGFVLLDKIGSAYSASDLSRDEVMKAIDYVL